MTEVRDIAWLAGLLEGEGCFHLDHSITIRLSMTDLDVVERAASMLGSSVKVWDRSNRPNRKRQYYTSIHGPRAASWMMTLYTFMCSRRRARIDECLRVWRRRKINNNQKEFCKRGHPLLGENLRVDPKSRGRVCRACQQMHQREYKERRRELEESSLIH